MSKSPRLWRDPAKGGGKFQFMILIVLIVILLVVAIIISLPRHKKENSIPDKLIIPDNTKVEVINSSGEMPNISSTEQSSPKSNSPQQDPATIQDLGSDVNQPTNIEDLLKGKEIEIKK